MSKTLSDVRLIVTVRDSHNSSAWSKHGEACLMELMIRRHVNYVGNVVIEKEYACEYCGRPWTEDSDEYNGGCCKDDDDRGIQ